MVPPMKQFELGEAAGVSPPSVSIIEAGKQNVTLIKANDLADAVGQTLASLLTPVGESKAGDNPPSECKLAIELDPGDAFVIARIAAQRLGRPIQLVNPATRQVDQVINPPATPTRPPRGT